MIGKTYPFGIPKFSMGMVDVRDVAKAHLQAVKVPEAANKRFMLVNQSVWSNDLGHWLKEKWNIQYPKITTCNTPKWLVWMGSWFNSDAKMIYPLLGTEKTFENSETKQILGIEFTDIKSSVCEMSESLIETGYVKGPKMPKSSRKQKSSG